MFFVSGLLNLVIENNIDEFIYIFIERSCLFV